MSKSSGKTALLRDSVRPFNSPIPQKRSSSLQDTSVLSPHTWKQRKLVSPEYCFTCKNAISTKHAFRCKNCKLHCHSVKINFIFLLLLFIFKINILFLDF